MDRDNRWERVEKGYNAVFGADGARFPTADAAVEASYKDGKFDEFITPSVIGDYKGLKDNDSVIFFNFRSDRAREISRALIYKDFDAFVRKGGFRKIYYAGMTQYDASFPGREENGNNAVRTAFSPKSLANTFGEFVSKLNKTQVRIAETEKYAHVTFFFNGGVEEPNKGEKRILVPSPKVATYDLQPQMSAKEVTDGALAEIKKGEADFMVLNYANCDMVGHTGIFEAAVKAVSFVDACVGELTDAVLRSGGAAIITADHGNAEQMTFPDGSPCTSHTTNKVPLILVAPAFAKATLRADGSLRDVIPTLLRLAGITPPPEMDGKSLIAE